MFGVVSLVPPLLSVGTHHRPRLKFLNQRLRWDCRRSGFWSRCFNCSRQGCSTRYGATKCGWTGLGRDEKGLFFILGC